MIATRYGSVGSWFQEGFASLVELPADAARRRSAMIDQPEDAIPWDRFLTMPHPATEGVNRARRSSGGRGAGPVRVSVPGGVGLFYSQALTVLEYVLDVGGPGTLERLATWLGGRRNGGRFPPSPRGRSGCHARRSRGVLAGPGRWPVGGGAKPPSQCPAALDGRRVTPGGRVRDVRWTGSSEGRPPGPNPQPPGRG